MFTRGFLYPVLGISEVIGYRTIFGEIVNTWLISIVCKSIDIASLGFLKSQAILQTSNTCYKIIFSYVSGPLLSILFILSQQP